MIFDFFKKKTEKRKGPTEIIESDEHIGLEQDYVKILGKNLYDVAEDRKSGSVRSDTSKIRKYLKENQGKHLTKLHTHPMNPGEEYLAFPTIPDLRVFFMDKKYKTSIIAQTDSSTGKVMGYTILRKKKNFPKNPHSGLEGEDYLTGLEFWYKNIASKNYFLSHDSVPADLMASNFRGIAKQFNLAYKFVPAEGYELDRFSFNFVPKIEKNLEKKIALIIGIASLTFSLIFFSPNLTGNIIDNLTIKSSNFIGIGLFLVGLVLAFIYSKKK